MDEKKIIIVNLSKGLVGEGNANLLGSMIITKIYLAAMSRADVSQGIMTQLPNFYLYVDEFQSFANESFADILSEARKYKLNLTLAHQYLEQMSEEVRAAVIGNVGTMIAFRVGAFDAEVLEKEFAPQFTAEDMVNLGFAQVYLKLMIDGVSSQPFSAVTMAPISQPMVSHKEAVIMNSRTMFGRSRDAAEMEIEKQLTEEQAPGAPSVSSRGVPPRMSAPPISGERSQNLKQTVMKEEFISPRVGEQGAPNLGGLRGALASAMNEKIVTPPPPPPTSPPPRPPQPPRQEIRQEPPRNERPRSPEIPRNEPRPTPPPPRESQPTRESGMPPRVEPRREENRNQPKPNIPPPLGKQSLKEALNELLAQEKKNESTESKNSVEVSSPKKEIPLEPNNWDNNLKQPKEIPEETLKKMLEVPNE